MSSRIRYRTHSRVQVSAFLVPHRCGSSTQASCGPSRILKGSSWSSPFRKRWSWLAALSLETRWLWKPGKAVIIWSLSAGNERRHPAAGVCGGFHHSAADVWRLPSGGSQGLLEGRRASETEGKSPFELPQRRKRRLQILYWRPESRVFKPDLCKSFKKRLHQRVE